MCSPSVSIAKFIVPSDPIDAGALYRISRKGPKRRLSLEMMPPDIIGLVLGRLQHDVPSLRAARLSCKRLEASAVEVLFRKLLIYQEPDSWNRLRKVANQPSLARLVRTVEVAMIGLLPQSWYQEPCFHIWSKRTKAVAGKDYCKSKITIHTPRWHWTLFLNRRKFVAARDRFRSYCDWVTGERYMVTSGISDESEMNLDFHLFKNLKEIQTIDSGALKKTAPDRRGRPRYHRRERECWIEDSWSSESREDGFIPWNTYQLVQAFLEDPDDFAMDEEYEATYKLWARNTHLSSVLHAAETAGHWLTSLCLSNMSDILSTDHHPNELDPTFELIHLQHLSLNFAESYWRNDLGGILDDPKDAESMPWGLPSWCKALGRLTSLHLTQNPHMKPGLDIVSLLLECAFPKLTHVRFRHVTTDTDCLALFMTSNVPSLQEVCLDRLVMSPGNWTGLEQYLDKSEPGRKFRLTFPEGGWFHWTGEPRVFVGRYDRISTEWSKIGGSNPVLSSGPQSRP